MKSKFKHPAGLSSLLVVFLVSIILGLVLIVIQLNSLLEAKRAAQVLYSQTAFFAAEGALYQTVQRLEDNPGWPEYLPWQDSYHINETLIRRTITLVDEGPQVKIDITATVKQAKRRLTANFGHRSEEKPPLDIILVMDVSGSMKGEPLNRSAEAAITFVDLFETEETEDRIGLISYSDNAEKQSGLTDNFTLLRNQIAALSTGGRTNIGDALFEAVSELNENGREETTKVIVILSDGLANEDHADICTGCTFWPCLNPGSGFSPDNSGNCCTDDAVSQIAAAKIEPYEYVVFAILLNNINQSECGNISSTEDLGRLTLLRVSSEETDRPLPEIGETYTYYKETGDSSELENIYREIAATISSPNFLELWEEAPEP
ncbi:MAG: VWA domain-containing protein [Candidatus Pacebacteria bacterium]|nr:VWA domain-containing protein [Candidatus Paceibacterota bacterium]